MLHNLWLKLSVLGGEEKYDNFTNEWSLHHGCQGPCSSTFTSWCFQWRLPRFKSPHPYNRIIKINTFMVSGYFGSLGFCWQSQLINNWGALPQRTLDSLLITIWKLFIKYFSFHLLYINSKAILYFQYCRFLKKNFGMLLSAMGYSHVSSLLLNIKVTVTCMIYSYILSFLHGNMCFPLLSLLSFP